MTDVPAWRTLWLLRRFVRPHLAAIAFGLVLLLGIAAMDLLKPWPLKFVLDDVILGPAGDRASLVLLLAALSLVAIAALEGLMSFLLVYFLNRAGRTIVFELRRDLFDHLQRLSLRFHSRRSTGDVLTRVTSDVKALRDVLTESLAELLNSVVVLVGMAAVLLWLDWRLALVAIGASPALFLALRRYSARIREYSRAERRREGSLAGVAYEALGAIRVTRLFAREDETRRRFQTESEASLQSGLAAALTEERFAWVIDVMAAAVTAVVLWYGVRRVQAGAITAGTLIVFVSYIRGFYKPLRKALKHANKISKAAARAERVLELLEEREVVEDQPGARPAPRLRGRIEFRGVEFAYEPGLPVLKGVDLVLPAGTTTALVGPTGAGKSTLVSLVPRLHDPTAGTVAVDGHDVRSFTLRSLRDQISVVLQEPILLSASVAENIAYGNPEATFDDIVAAARAANAHEFVSRLPRGYETEIGERGETLSGGQRQRLAIARAIVRDTPIVILDEPVAALDAASAASVLEALERLMERKTLLVITHDLALVRRADRVAVLEDGTIVEEGPSSEVAVVEAEAR